MKSTFLIIVACIVLFCAIVFILYCCGYLVNDCMTHPVNFGCKKDAIVYPTTITENALISHEQV